jgi:phosphoadenosine phosphosulfate reductase
VDPAYFWKNNSLGPAQVDGFKAWLKDAEINDPKNKLTHFGELLQQIYVDDMSLTWELILINLSYNSFIINWFANNIKVGQSFDRKILEGLINEQGYASKGKTVANAVAALIQTFEYSPIGYTLNLSMHTEGKTCVRGVHEGLSKIGLAYSLYKYAEKKGVLSLKVSDFYSDECKNGPFRVFGIQKPQFVNGLKALNSANNRVLIAELAMGLDSITLREDLTALSCVEALL